MRAAPSIASEPSADGVRLALAGDWTLERARGWSARRPSWSRAGGAVHARCSIFPAVKSLDTAGAWVIDRSRQLLAAAGVRGDAWPASAPNTRPCCARRIIARTRRRSARAPRSAIALLADIGESVFDGRASTCSPGSISSAAWLRSASRAAVDPEALALHVAGVPPRSLRAARRAHHPDDQFLRRRHRRPAGHIPARAFRRELVHRRSRGHSHPARTRRAADLDHGRRPLGLGDHGRNRRDEDARGDRRAARDGARSAGSADPAASGRAGHLAADSHVPGRPRGAVRRHVRHLGLWRRHARSAFSRGCNTRSTSSGSRPA